MPETWAMYFGEQAGKLADDCKQSLERLERSCNDYNSAVESYNAARQEVIDASNSLIFAWDQLKTEVDAYMENSKDGRV